MSNVYNLYNSAFATFVAEYITLPICAIKTVFQTKNDVSIYQSAKFIYDQNGIKGFYKASTPALAAQVVSTSSKFYLYKLLDKNNKSLPIKMKNGAIAGLCSSILTHPLDVIKTILQKQESIKIHYESEGIRFLYRGYLKTVAKVSLGSALFLPLYDWTKLKYGNGIFAAVVSATISTTILQPLDRIKVITK